MTGATEAHVVVTRRSGFTVDVELGLEEGTTTALLGPNGAGKSTVIDALAGVLRLDEGHIRVDGDLVDDAAANHFVPSRLRHVGVVFQDDRLFPHLDVLDNVAFGPRSRGASRRAAREAATTWMGRLGVDELARRRPRELSGGQVQRVALCRALAAAPRLLLLDEPLSSLDVTARAQLRRTIASQLQDVAAPRLLVTHDPVEAFLLADRVAIIEDGRVTQTGTADDIRARPQTAYAADLAGTNLLHGTARDGTVVVGDHELAIANSSIDGPVLVVIAPHAIALAQERPAGSPRNVWSGVVTHVESLGDRVRVGVGAPLPLTAEVTPAAVEELELVPGRPTWLSIKATEIAVTPDA